MKPEHFDSEMEMAQQAFDKTEHEDQLGPLLKELDIPQRTKADLWEAKRNQRIQSSDPKRAKLEQMAQIPENILEMSEKYPNTMKYLTAPDEMPKTAGGTVPQGSKESKGQSAGPAPKVNTNNPLEAQNAEQPNLAGLPPLPPGHTHFQKQDGSHWYVPHENLGKVAKVEPGIKILRSA